MTASIEQAIRLTFSTDFPVLRPTVPIAYDNMEFDPEVDAVDASGDPIPYVDLTILPADREPVDLGTTTQRNIGIVWIRVWTKAMSGSGEAAEIGRDAGSVFEAKTINGITFRSARQERVGREGARYRRDVKIDYLADEVP